MAFQVFADQGSQKRPDDDAEQALRTERKPDDRNDEADVHAPDARLAPAEFLCADGRDYIIQDGDDDGDGRCDNNLRCAERGRRVETEQKECRPA